MGNASTTRRRLLGGFAGLGAAAGLFGRRVRGQDADPSATESPSPISCIPSAGATASPVVPWASPPATGQIQVVLARSPDLEELLPFSDIQAAAEILDAQVQNDFRKFWDVDARVISVDPNQPIDLSYWVIQVLKAEGAEDGCPASNGQTPTSTGTAISTVGLNGHNFCTLGQSRIPRAWVYYTGCEGWIYAASHECLEMLVDPYFEVTHTGPAPCGLAGDATYIHEVCDPCPVDDDCYSINGKPVANFVTPAYFDIANRPRSGVTYDFLNRIQNPLEPLDGGNQNFQKAGETQWHAAFWNSIGCASVSELVSPGGGTLNICL